VVNNPGEWSPETSASKSTVPERYTVPEPIDRELGIVSNCWKVQLDGGQSLDELIASAADRGYRRVELRQGCLGAYEADVANSGSSVAARARLGRLSQRFSPVRLSLAVSLPIFGGSIGAADPRFQTALEAEMALARGDSPQLRLVDIDTRAERLDENAKITAVETIAAMTRTVREAGGWLAIEHAYQAWADFRAVMQLSRDQFSREQLSREQLGASAHHLRCCFDPCNLLLTEPPSTIPGIVDSIAPGDVSMIHLKQRRDGLIQPDVSEGDLDWPLLVRSLDSHGHRGPWLFEVAPHGKIWDNLRRSAGFLFGSE
jgi:sugar phosphate isomerase/epimerase